MGRGGEGEVRRWGDGGDGGGGEQAEVRRWGRWGGVEVGNRWRCGDGGGEEMGEMGRSHERIEHSPGELFEHHFSQADISNLKTAP